MAAAERLTDYQEESNKQDRFVPEQSFGRYGTGPRPSAPWHGGTHGKPAWRDNHRPVVRDRPTEGRLTAVRKTLKCTICESNDHGHKDCPDRLLLLDAIASLKSKGKEKKKKSPPGSDAESEEEYVGAVVQECASLSWVASPSSAPKSPKSPKGKDRPQARMRKDLMYVDAIVNGKKVRALIDTGASHNYLASTQVQRLDVKLSKGESRVKSVNASPQQVAAVATDVPLKVGPLESLATFSVIELDDFDLILGLEFLRQSEVAIVPEKRALMTLGSRPQIIPTLTGSMAESSLSAIRTLEEVEFCPTTKEESRRLEPYVPPPMRSRAIVGKATPFPGTLAEHTVSGPLHRSDRRKGGGQHPESREQGQVAGKHCPSDAVTTGVETRGQDTVGWERARRRRCWCTRRSSEEGPSTIRIGSMACILEPTSARHVTRAPRAHERGRGDSTAGRCLFKKTPSAFTKKFLARRGSADEAVDWKKDPMAPRTSPNRRGENVGRCAHGPSRSTVP